MTDRNTVDLAREVLDAVQVMDDTPGTLYLDGPTHEHEEAAGAILDAAPSLARAVIRVKGLTDDREAEKRRTDIAESDAETLYKRCERIREERDVFFRQCEYALDRAEEAEAKLARVEELADRLDDGHLRYLIRAALNGENR